MNEIDEMNARALDNLWRLVLESVATYKVSMPGEYWHCLGCGRERPWNYRCIAGEYPEDGEVFCSKGCRTAYERKDPALYRERRMEEANG